MRLYEDIGTFYKLHGVIQGLGIAGNVYANTITDLKRKASETANGYFRPVDSMKIWNSQTGEFLFSMTRINKKSPAGTFTPGKWN